MEGGWHGAFAPPSAIPGWNPAGGGGCGLLPLHQQVWATPGWIFGVHYPRGAQDGDGEGLVPSSGPKQWGCAARVSPSSYVTVCSCHGHGGAGGGPGSGNGGLEAPSQGSILTSTTGDCVSRSLESRVLTSGTDTAFSRDLSVCSLASYRVLKVSVLDRKSTRLNSSHKHRSRMPSSA